MPEHNEHIEDEDFAVVHVHTHRIVLRFAHVQKHNAPGYKLSPRRHFEQIMFAIWQPFMIARLFQPARSPGSRLTCRGRFGDLFAFKSLKETLTNHRLPQWPLKD